MALISHLITKSSIINRHRKIWIKKWIKRSFKKKWIKLALPCQTYQWKWNTTSPKLILIVLWQTLEPVCVSLLLVFSNSIFITKIKEKCSDVKRGNRYGECFTFPKGKWGRFFRYETFTVKVFPTVYVMASRKKAAVSCAVSLPKGNVRHKIKCLCL